MTNVTLMGALAGLLLVLPAAGAVLNAVLGPRLGRRFVNWVGPGSIGLAFVTFGRFLNSQDGQVFAFMVIVVAASEVVVGLALITTIFRTGREMDVDDLSEMRE